MVWGFAPGVGDQLPLSRRVAQPGKVVAIGPRQVERVAGWLFDDDMTSIGHSVGVDGRDAAVTGPTVGGGGREFAR